MADCLFCGADNIDGADQCEECGTSLWVDVKSLHGGDECLRTLVRDIDAPPAIMVNPSTTFQEVVDRLVAGNAGCVLVVPNGKLTGIFSERDLLTKVGARYSELKSSPVVDFMTANPEYINPDCTVAFALNRMDLGGFRHLPIVDNGKPVGVISVRNLLQYLSGKYLQTK